MFARTEYESNSYYYEAIEVNVMESGCYNLTSISTIDTYSYLYKNNFNPTFFNSIHLISENDRSFHSNQFEHIVRLETNIKYILVVTTNDPNVTGMFSLIVIGPKKVRFNRFSKYLCFSLLIQDS